MAKKRAKKVRGAAPAAAAAAEGERLGMAPHFPGTFFGIDPLQAGGDGNALVEMVPAGVYAIISGIDYEVDQDGCIRVTPTLSLRWLGEMPDSLSVIGDGSAPVLDKPPRAAPLQGGCFVVFCVDGRYWTGQGWSCQIEAAREFRGPQQTVSDALAAAEELFARDGVRCHAAYVPIPEVSSAKPGGGKAPRRLGGQN